MQGQMDHGLANARFNEQQENIAPILDALRQYGSGVAGRVSAFADDPAQALYGGFADTMGINLDRPMDEYAEMARNPQAGEIDPNSPAVLEAMGWMPGPMGALGTIAGKGAKLPMDEASRMQRARDMGFSKDLYHGTTADIEEFIPGDIGIHLGTDEQAGQRILDVASQRGDIPKFSNNRDVVENANILPVKADIGESLIMPDVGRWDDSEMVLSSLEDMPEFRGRFDDAWEELGVKYQFEDTEDWVNSPENREMLEEIASTLRNDGYGSIKYENAVENKYGNLADLTPSAKAEKNRIEERIREIHKLNAGRRPSVPEDVDKIQEWLDAGDDFYTPKEKAEISALRSRSMQLSEQRNDQNSYIILDPAKIRSKFAKFDPSKKESANLLAGLGGLGLGLNYLGSSEDAAETDKTTPLIDALRNKEFY